LRYRKASVAPLADYELARDVFGLSGVAQAQARGGCQRFDPTRTR
jgi:hypothetical protein